MNKDPRSIAEQLDDVLARVERAADEAWMGEAWSALLFVMESGEEFTTDAVWAVLTDGGIDPPREPRAMGPVVRLAITRGLCVNTGRSTKSTRPGCHRRPVPVYRPLHVGGRRATLVAPRADQ